MITYLISLIQTAEGALNETHSILQRMRELAVQSSNDSNTDSDRAELQKEVDQLTNALNDISENTEFNTQKLLDGNFTDATFHVGANESQNLQLSISDMSANNLNVADTYTVEGENLVDADGNELTYKAAADAQDYSVETTVDEESDETTSTITYGGSDSATWQAADPDDGTVAGYYDGEDLVLAADSALGDGATGTIAAVEEGYYDGDTLRVEGELEAGDTVTVGINISSQEDADGAITTIQSAIDNVSAERSKLGALQNRLDHTINNLGTSAENITAAESRIRDVDMAKEMMEFTKNNILSQAAQSMLAQANQQPQGVLQLLQ